MKDTHVYSLNDKDIGDIVAAVEQMVKIHDRNADGFDFLEMYTASGGNLQDL